jgi:pectate lyase
VPTGGVATGGTGGTGGSHCLANYVFCDDFEDGDAAGWNPGGGTWAIVVDGTNHAYQGAGSSQESVVNATATLADQTVRADIKVVTFGGTGSAYRAGIIARYASPSNFYTLSIDQAGALHLYKSTSVPSSSSGTCGAIASGVDPLAWHTYQIVVAGTPGSIRITTYLDGVLRHDCTTTSTSVPAAGPIGVVTYGATVAMFDNVTASSP